MLEKFYLVLVVFVTVLVLSIVSYKRGRNAEKIKQLKEEIKRRAEEQRYANEKIDYVRNLNKSDVDAKLQQLANKKSK